MIILYNNRNRINNQNQTASAASQASTSRSNSSILRTNSSSGSNPNTTASQARSTNQLDTPSYHISPELSFEVADSSDPRNPEHIELKYCKIKVGILKEQQEQFKTLLKDYQSEEQKSTTSAAQKQSLRTQRTEIEKTQTLNSTLLGFWEENKTAWTQEVRRELPPENTPEFKKIQIIRHTIAGLENDYEFALENENAPNPNNQAGPNKQAIKEKIDNVRRVFQYNDNTNASLDRALNILGITQEEASNFVYQSPSNTSTNTKVESRNNYYRAKTFEKKNAQIDTQIASGSKTDAEKLKLRRRKNLNDQAKNFFRERDKKWAIESSRAYSPSLDERKKIWTILQFMDKLESQFASRASSNPNNVKSQKNIRIKSTLESLDQILYPNNSLNTDPNAINRALALIEKSKNI